MPNLGNEVEQQEVKCCSSSLRRGIRQFYDARKWEEKILVLMSERKETGEEKRFNIGTMRFIPATLATDDVSKMKHSLEWAPLFYV